MNNHPSPEPTQNPNPGLIVDPPWPLRGLLSRLASRSTDARLREKRRAAFEVKRRASGKPHRVDYFHQLDDPYSHLVAQVLKPFTERYHIELIPHLVQATGGRNQPEMDKLARWARRDCEQVAPHLGLSFPANAEIRPSQAALNQAANRLAAMTPAAFLDNIDEISEELWDSRPTSKKVDLSATAQKAMQDGSQQLVKLGHYSGATFHYGGEFYWGVDRLFHLEQRLMDLGVSEDAKAEYLVPRPKIDIEGVDASALTLHFYPSLNSPYTAIIYDRSIELARACNIRLEHKPVLPMVMRGVPITPKKSAYLLFDSKREAEHLDVPFGPVLFPIGTPTRRAYSIFGWAKEQGRETQLLSALLKLAFAEGVSLANDRGMRRAVTEAGLDWQEAKQIIGNNDWMESTARNQQEMVDGMGLWGVPCYRLSGPTGEPDLAVWGQDRLWLVAAEIRRRVNLPN